MCPEYKQILIDAALAQARFLEARAEDLQGTKPGAPNLIAREHFRQEARNLRDAAKALEAVQ